ncbi:MAG: OmpA family protein [Cyclobacteriaceae bacterium]
MLVFGIVLLVASNSAWAQEQEGLGVLINSPYDELDPVLDPTGTTLYFTRTKHPQNSGGKRDQGDIWISQLEGGQWSEAQNPGAPLNNNKKNTVIGFSANGSLMYLADSYTRKGMTGKGITFSRKTPSGWSKPQVMPIDYFHNKSDLQSMCISEDGKIMILSVESFSTYGAEDLYVSFLQNNGKWSEPKNLGPIVNSKYQEMTPKLAADNVTLFFASNGHGGFGSRDIFSTKRIDDSWVNWSTPENLGRKVNTKGIELSYFIPSSGDYAYMVSTQNSDGYGDVKRVRIKPEERPNNKIEPILASIDTVQKLPEPDTVIVITKEPVNETIEAIHEIVTNPKVTLEGSVSNSQTNNPVFATIWFQDLSGGIDQSVVSSNVSTGDFSVNLPTSSRYKVTIKADGYLNYETEVELEPGNENQLNTDFALTPLEVGVTVQLENVLFEKSTTNLLQDSYPELDRVAQMMEDNPTMEIELSGHTDNRGSAKLNLKLSQDRVQTVVLYLVGKGVVRSRMTGRGFGGTRPISSNRSEETRKLNRRVEFTITKK